MLDRLLGRAELRAEVSTLENDLARCREERDRLEAQLDATDDRRRSAVSDYQSAREQINRLQDRIEQLEAERDRETSAASVSVRSRDRFSHRRMADLLSTLEPVRTTPEGAFTAMVTDDRPVATNEHFGDRAALVDRLAPCICLFDEFGLVEVALTPPWPPDPFETWSDRFSLEASWFIPTAPFTFAVVRSDLFAMGRYTDDGLSDIEGFESDVIGRHSKGGFSQARFERRREEQIDRHLEKCRSHLSSITDDRPLVLTGSSTVLDALDVPAAVRATVDASGAPADALDTAFEEFWTTDVVRL